jgi:hypothetical protein
MSKLTEKEKKRRYHAIYNQIYLNPRVHVHEISKNLKIARNTVSSYLDYMYKSGILFGPEIRLKYYAGLDKYMYFAKFDDPYEAFDQIRMDPRITYTAMFFGDWNIMLMSDEQYDVSQIRGFENLVFKGERYDITTPRTMFRNWKAAFQKMKDETSQFDPDGIRETNLLPRDPPDWDEEEWSLFFEYKYNFRKKVTPVLRKHLISSDKFYQWMSTLFDNVNVIVRFYADGIGNYTLFGFLFRTRYAEAVTSLLSNLPTSINCTHVDGGLFVMLCIKSDVASTFTNLFDVLHEMRTCGMVEKFHQAIATLYYTTE